ncbi:MAG: zinc ribbon domain-containing protein [Desulfobacteraceae bacterium]|nr:zinc ribbon domain-containing protein [Desulfobacteraceae bacterium]MCF8094982.1 zinc ribbon domain-containing protein [Desulfobacteraceae bacterium]
MPIYEYQCEKCKRKFEAIVIGSNSETPVCDKCGSREVTRCISAANTIGGSSGKINTTCSSNPSSGFS